jgi:hypothetical protein
VCPHGWSRGHHPGAEGRWDAIIVLSSIAFCLYNGRKGNLRYLPAVARYMTWRALTGLLAWRGSLPPCIAVENLLQRCASATMA